MAKKKTDAATAPATHSATPTRKAVAAKATSAKPSSGVPAGFDTDLVASAAANLLMAKLRGRDKLANPASIKQIKSDLNKPADVVAGNAMVSSGILKQSADPIGRPKLPHA